jgi:hypothetical protein
MVNVAAFFACFTVTALAVLCGHLTERFILVSASAFAIIIVNFSSMQRILSERRGADPFLLKLVLGLFSTFIGIGIPYAHTPHTCSEYNEPLPCS